jgi:hypothetical protein
MRERFGTVAADALPAVSAPAPPAAATPAAPVVRKKSRRFILILVSPGSRRTVIRNALAPLRAPARLMCLEPFSAGDITTAKFIDQEKDRFSDNFRIIIDS